MISARNLEELRKMWKFFGPPTRKFITEEGFDFTTGMLVGISLGQKPTGGYAVRIEDTREEDGFLCIRYRERKPGPEQSLPRP